MVRIEFTPASIQELNYERYHHPHPKVQIKMDALFLKAKDLSNKEICRIMEISRSSLQRYLKEYVQGGIERLKVVKFYQPQSSLMDHQGTLKEYFQ